MATKAATGFRVAYLIVFMIAAATVLVSIRLLPETETVNVARYMEENDVTSSTTVSQGATTEIKKPGLLDFDKVFDLGDYILFAVDLLILAVVVNTAITIAVQLGSPGVSTYTLAADLQDAYLAVMPHSTLTGQEGIPVDEIVFDLGNIIGAIILLVLLPAAFLAGAGFVRDGDTNLAIVSFVSFQLMLAVAQFVQVHNKYAVDADTTISLGTENALLVALDLDSSGLIPLITSPIFLIGMILYVFLEISFQTSYALNIIEPMSEREVRIKRHLQRIAEFRPSGGEEGTTVQSVGRQSKRFDVLAASYMRELVEKRVFKKGERTEDMKTTLRLQGYLNSLIATDLEVVDKLTARSAQPNATAIAMRVAPLTAFRITAVIVIAYLIMDPAGILDFLGIIESIPPLKLSLELTQPEFRTIALLNVILLILGISVALHYWMITRGQVPEAVTVQKIDTMIDFDDAFGTEAPIEEGDFEEGDFEEEEEEFDEEFE
jgi:hypothetical protein